MPASAACVRNDVERALDLCMTGRWKEYRSFVSGHHQASAMPWMVAQAAMSSNAPQVAQENIEFALSSNLWDPPAMRELAASLVTLGQFEVAGEITAQAEKIDAQLKSGTENPGSEPQVEALLFVSQNLARVSTQLTRLCDELKQRPRRARASIRVVFLVQSPVYWNTWSELISLMQRDPRFEVRIVLADQLEGTRAAYECSAREFLVHKEVDFVHVDYYDLESDAPDLVFYQSPYETTIHPKFRIERVKASGARVVYTPYCVDMCGGRFLEKVNFQSEMVTQAWRVYARSARQKREFARLCPAGNAHVEVLGAPKLDALLAHTPGELFGQVKKFARGRKIVLYNAHFRIQADGGGYSTYPTWEPRLRDILEQRDDMVLLFRPHPNFFGYMRENGILSAQGVESLIAKYEASENIFLDRSFDYRDAMFVSDMMLSDASSLLLEFASLRKPVVYFRNDRGPGLNHDRDFAKALYQPESAADLASILDQLLTGNDPLEKTRNGMLQELLFTPDQGCSQAILEDLARLLEVPGE